MDVSETGARPRAHGDHGRPVVADAHSDRSPPNRQAPRPPPPGNAAGPNTTWAKAPVSPAQTAKAPQVAGQPAKHQLRLAAIDRAYAALEEAGHDLNLAHEKRQRAENGIPPGSAPGALNARLDLLAKAEPTALLRCQEMMLRLREAIRAEAERLSGPSAFTPQSRNPANATPAEEIASSPADVRRAEEQIAFQYSGWKNLVILNAARANQEDRVLLALSNVSEAMSKGPLTEAQEREKLEIIGDAADFVAGSRPDERSLNADEVRIQRFDRLKDLLKKMHSFDATLDRTPLVTVIIRCAAEMDLVSTADLARLQDIVGTD